MPLSMISVRARRTLAALFTVLLASAGTASAKDSLAVTVTPPQSDTVAVVNNGQATGTIQLFYTVNASQFATGFFAAFDLDWIVAQGRQATNYGAGLAFTLVQDQQGGHVSLGAAPDSFTLTQAGQSGESTIYVHITPDKDGNAPPSADGTDLVGNLKLVAGSAVSSVTNIQVHILLVHPSSCLRVYNFVTDQDFSLGILETAEVKVGTVGAKKGLVVSSNPGQFSNNVLIANACTSAKTFDLGVGLDPSFSINATGNPVAAYSAAGEYDTSNFGDVFVGPKTNYGQALCLPNVTVAPASSLLVTVHSEVTKNVPGTTLPADRTFDFAAALFATPNAGCNGALLTDAPAAMGFTLPFTLN